MKTSKLQKINPAELRLGNWFYYDHKDGRKGYARVNWGIDIDNLKSGDINGFPIPITPEILEKAGFKNSDKGIYENDDIQIMEYIDGYLLLNGENRTAWMNTFKFLHQLQNINFWLSGKELEINLPQKLEMIIL